jgi:hypothetical protein
VIVNRLWGHHFGRGIVATPNDFGAQGEPPSHPELLEWLASELIRNEWRLKSVHRLLMTSATYMQSADPVAESAKKDPDNRLFWRRTPRRLEAEAVRDSLLDVGGLLDRKMYGPGTLDENMTRRSIYFFIKRSRLIPMMMVFDAPEPLVSQGERPTTTIAPQALLFMNSPLVRKAAAGAGEAGAVEKIYPPPLGRSPTRRSWRPRRSSCTGSRSRTEGRQTGRVAGRFRPGPSVLERVCLCGLDANFLDRAWERVRPARPGEPLGEQKLLAGDERDPLGAARAPLQGAGQGGDLDLRERRARAMSTPGTTSRTSRSATAGAAGLQQVHRASSPTRWAA